MANMSVPVDGRRQYDFTTVVMANAGMGRPPLAGVREIFPGRFVTEPWPKPRPTSPSSGGFSGLAAAEAPAEAGPKSSAAARSIWPALR
jgi:hypothetical protein